jgi:hypothetical protein
MAAEVMEELNQPYDILLVERPHHAAKLDDYKLLIVPHLEILPDAWFEAIQRFIDHGGHVVSTGNTGNLDEHLRPRIKKWAGSGWKHFAERVEKLHASSRKTIGLHGGFERQNSPFAQAIDHALGHASVRLERPEPLLTINRTRLPDGEAVHLVNRFCNVFPRIPTTPRTGIVLHLRPAEKVEQVTWLSADMQDEDLVLRFDLAPDAALRVALPMLHVAGIVRVRYAR